MDARSFILGVACGAFLVVAAGWWLEGSDGSEFDTSRGQGINPAIIPYAGPSGSTTPRVQDTPRATTQETPRATTQETTEQPSTERSSAASASRWPSSLIADLEAEPKDDSWAYYMEQTMLQYLSSHSSIPKFDISRIECRTTKCQIEVIGYDESTVPVWTQVMYDIRQQPWSEFGEYGSSVGTVDGRLVIIGTFHRVQDNH